MRTNKLKRLIIWVLYLLPVIFFAICYFLITATEEDIAQGAGTTPNVWNDLVAAFHNNARLSDMYAWAVINFFDYQYSFGIDTIFRLLDVVAVISVLLLMTSVILGYKPRLRLKDALVFMGCFLLLILTPYGYTFYRGFSMIHNYLIISLALLGFSLPFLRKMSAGIVPKLYRRWWIAVPMGLIFGLSANFPPLAFLATYIIIKIWQFWKIKHSKNDTSNFYPEAWEWMMIGGMLISMLIGYVLGPGVSGYVSDPMYVNTYDYITISDIVQNFGGSVIRIFNHMVINFGRTLAPVLGVLLVGWTLFWLKAKSLRKKINLLPEDERKRRLMAGLAIFSGFAILAGSQIIMPVRLCLPAYLALVIVTLTLVKNWQEQISTKRTDNVLATAMIILAVVAIILRTIFAWDFHTRIGKALVTIKDAESDMVCVDPNELQQKPKMPLGMFQQEETFVLRQENSYEIYGKQVMYCVAE